MGLPPDGLLQPVDLRRPVRYAWLMIFHALDAANANELLLCASGLCRFHRRRDQAVTIRELIVLPRHRGQGIGRRLVEQAAGDAPKVIARCPASLRGNGFWLRIGFHHAATEHSRTGRAINVWERLSPDGR